MSFTFWSFPVFLTSVLTIALSICLYMWKVRPRLATHPELAPFFRRADTFWAWVKMRWDVAAAVVAAFLPTGWNMLLDLAVAVAPLDLSKLIIADWLRQTIMVIAAAAPLVRLKLTLPSQPKDE